MRRLLILVCVAGGCAKRPSPPMETVPPSTTVPALDAEASGVHAVPEPARCASLDTCLAMVGDVEIPYADFASVYDPKVAKYTSRGREIPATADRRYRKSISERLIYHEMLAQEASARGLVYDPEALAGREAQQRRGIRDWAKHLERRGETQGSLRDMYIAELLEVGQISKPVRTKFVLPRHQADRRLAPWRPSPGGTRRPSSRPTASAQDPPGAPVPA